MHKLYGILHMRVHPWGPGRGRPRVSRLLLYFKCSLLHILVHFVCAWKCRTLSGLYNYYDDITAFMYTSKFFCKRNLLGIILPSIGSRSYYGLSLL